MIEKLILTELKRCPFCGGNGKITTDGGGFRVCCEKCFASAQLSVDQEAATDTWNKRYHEWISTHDRFPEKGQQCLIYPVDGKPEVAHLEDGKFVFWDGFCIDANKISHWRPLPVLPEEVES